MRYPKSIAAYLGVIVAVCCPASGAPGRRVTNTLCVVASKSRIGSLLNATHRTISLVCANMFKQGQSVASPLSRTVNDCLTTHGGNQTTESVDDVFH